MKGSEENNNFVMFGNYRQYFEMLNAEQSHKLIIMLFDFAETNEIKQCDDININLVYKTITDNMIIGSRRRIASIENGKKGGRPRKSEKQEPKKDFREELYSNLPKQSYSNKITEQQKALILSLAKEKKYKMKRNVDEFTKAEASECITWLQELKVQSVLPILGDYNAQ